MERKTDFKAAVDARLSSMVLSDETKDNIRASVRPKRRRAPRLRRTLATAAAVVLTLAFGLTVAANVIPGFELFIERMGEEFRGLVQPLSGVSVHDGIRMEVVAAVHDGESLVVYLTLQDQKGDRIREDTRLEGVYIGEGGAPAFASIAHFDEESRTATFRITRSGLEPLDSEPLQIRVSCILSGLDVQMNVDTGYTVADVLRINPAPQYFLPEGADGLPRSYSVSHGMGSNFRGTPDRLAGALDKSEMPVLRAWDTPLRFDEREWFAVSAAGIVDDYLHIQLQQDTGAARYNSLRLYLDYPGRTSDEYPTTASLELGEPVYQYSMNFYPRHELILELPPGTAPKNLRLMANIRTWEMMQEGTWAATVAIDTSHTEITIPVEINLGDWTVHEIAVSSIGYTATGTANPVSENAFSDEGLENMFSDENFSVSIYCKDGSSLSAYGGMAAIFEGGPRVSKTYFARPIHLEEIERIEVNGQPLDFTLP